MSAGMKERPATDTIVHWPEEDHLSGRLGLVEDITAIETDFTVSSGDSNQVVPGQIYEIQDTGEYVLVTAVNTSTNVLTVVRGFGGTTATLLNGGTVNSPKDIQLITIALVQGSSRPVAIMNVGFPKMNYTQIIRDTWEVTKTARHVQFYSGDLVAKARRDAMLFHSEKIERALIWGKRDYGVEDGKPWYTMGGLLSFITLNTFTQGANTDYDDIDEFLRKIFERNIKGQPNERLTFCGNKVLQVLNKIARLDGDQTITPGETSFGLKVSKWMTPYGDISLMTHPLMNENPKWTKEMYVFHPGAIVMRWLRRTHEDMYDKDGTRAGVDADFGVITSELSMEYHVEATAGMGIGIATGAASV